MSLIQYEEQAARWESVGRAAEALVTDQRQMLALRCWLSSSGAKSQGISPLLAAFARGQRRCA